jgi:hypothetical protein
MKNAAIPTSSLKVVAGRETEWPFKTVFHLFTVIAITLIQIKNPDM